MSFNKKRRKSIFDEIFGGSLFGDVTEVFDEFSEGGYSISVVKTPKGTKVRARVGKDVEVNAFKKKLQQQYPNAEIEIEGGKKGWLIREVSTKPLKQKNGGSKS
jgi:hypothetical protein